jgi:hypothetical protein
VTWYQSVKVLNEPTDIGLDDLGRPMFSFNVEVVKAYSTTFIEEIVSILEGASLGTFGTDIFTGSKPVIPEGDGPYVSLAQTGGAEPMRTHSQVTTPAYPRPRLQVVVRAASQASAVAKAYAAYVALESVRNTEVTP